VIGYAGQQGTEASGGGFDWDMYMWGCCFRRDGGNWGDFGSRLCDGVVFIFIAVDIDERPRR
jgi:hypothetical protein